MRLSRRWSPRMSVLFLVLLLTLLVLVVHHWNWTEWNDRELVKSCPPSSVNQVGSAHRQSDHHDRSSKNIVDSLQRDQDQALAYVRALNEINSAEGSCRSRSPASEADIQTLKIFPDLNFQPDYLRKRDFWDSSLEKRYVSYKSDQTRPPMKVIVLPHSHTDPGWLKTFEDYFSQSVQSILDNMVTKMMQHKSMTFIWTEIAFFALWWDSALPTKRHQVRQLVKEGRLEFTSGTWVMTDEASPHLYSMLDQMIEGHQWLKSRLGVVPTSVWSVDPFGHGPVAPYLLRQAGLENTVVQRIHYGWKRWMADHQMSDFWWQMPWKTDKESDNILCHNFPYDIYTTKHSCGPDPKICLGFDFRSVRGEYNEFTLSAAPITRINVQAKADVLMEQYAKSGSLTTHNVVLALVGDDFRFNHEIEWDQQYTNYQNIFNFVNGKKERYNGTEIKFGTLTEYFDEIRKRAQRFPTLSGDFFPYADIFSEGRPAYWTGYFTSRPFFKALAREVEGRLRGAEILFTFSFNWARQKDFTTAKRILDRDYGLLVKARRWMALFQHHDGITGTSKTAVMQDYGQKLFRALKSATSVEARSASILLSDDDEQWQRIRLLPGLQRPAHDRLAQRITVELGEEADQVDSENYQRSVVLYNSDSHFRYEMIRLKISWPYVRVVDPEGRKIRHQVNPVWKLQRRKQLEHDTESYQLVFIASLAPLSLTSYTIQRLKEADVSANATRTLIFSSSNSSNALKGPFDFQELKQADIQVENQKNKLLFDGQTGFLKSIRSKSTDKSTPCAMQFAAYPSSMFHSGAYLFQPDANAPEPQIDVLKGLKPQIFIISGPVMSEVSAVYNELLIHTTFILHSHNKLLEDLVWMETTLDMGSAPGYREHEFFIRFKTNLLNSQAASANASAEFYTDQNGFTFARRARVRHLGIEASYYPISSSAFIQDESQRLNLLVNSAKGFSSLLPGWMEFMIDRRTIHDDGRGMGEGMMENLPTTTAFILLLEEKEPETSPVPNLSVEATSASMMLMYPAASFTVDNVEAVDELAKKRITMLNQPMPCNAHLIGLRTLSEPEMESSELPSSSALMTVHNRAFDCSIQTGVARCGLSGQPDRIFHPKTSFIGLDVASMARTSLTGLSQQGLTDFDSATVPLMELGSFNLTFT